MSKQGEREGGVLSESDCVRRHGLQMEYEKARELAERRYEPAQVSYGYIDNCQHLVANGHVLIIRSEPHGVDN